MGRVVRKCLKTLTIHFDNLSLSSFSFARLFSFLYPLLGLCICILRVLVHRHSPFFHSTLHTTNISLPSTPAIINYLQCDKNRVSQAGA
jgi:hypothetical protein